MLRAAATIEDKAVTSQRRNHFARREAAERPVIDGHESDGDGYAGIDSEPRLIARGFGQGSAALGNAFNHKMNDVVDVSQGLFARVAPCCNTTFVKRRAVSAPAVLIGFDDDGERVGMHGWMRPGSYFVV